MKSNIILFMIVIASAFSSCKKCETCTPYIRNNNKPAKIFQVVRVCSKVEIEAYQNGTNYSAGAGQDSAIYFICK